MNNTREEQSSLKEFYMKKFLDWLKADNAMTEVMRSRVKEAIALYEEWEKIQECKKIRECKKIQECIMQETPLNENVIGSLLDAQKVANLICQYMTLTTLVRDMRKAQEDIIQFLNYSDVPDAYIDKVCKLEDKVDYFLKSMEETK